MLLTPDEKPETGAFYTCLQPLCLCLVLTYSDLLLRSAILGSRCSAARTQPALEVQDEPQSWKNGGELHKRVKGLALSHSNKL